MFLHLRQLGKESVIYGVAGVASRVITIFLVPIYTRLFTQTQYGVLSLVSIVLSLTQIFMVLALDAASYRWFYETEEEDDRKKTIATWVWCEIVASTVLGLILILFAKNFAIGLIHDVQAANLFIITGVSLPFSVLFLIIINWLRFQRRAVMTVIFTFATSLLTILLNILLVVVLRPGIMGVYVSQLITYICGTILAAWIMRDWIHPAYFQAARLWKMLRYAMPLIPASVASWVVMLSGRFFIERYGGMNNVAVYQLGATLAMVISLATTAFQQAWGPFSMSIYKRPEARKVYAAVFLVYIWLVSAASAALAIFSPELIRLFATDQYLGATPVVGVLAFTYLLIGLTYIANIGPSIAKSMAPAGIAIVASAVLNIGLNFLLVPLYGNLGAAVSSLLSQAIVPIYIFFRAQSMYPIPYRFGMALWIIVFSFALIMVSSVVNISTLWLSICFKLSLVVLYFPLLFVLRIVSPGQLKQGWQFLKGKIGILEAN